MNTLKPIWARRSLSFLGKLTVAALLVATLGYAVELLHLGLDREVSIAVVQAAATLVAVGAGIGASVQQLRSRSNAGSEA